MRLKEYTGQLIWESKCPHNKRAYERLKQREIPEMKDNHATIVSEVGPDLSVPPHVLSILMELFAGERQQDPSLPEQLVAHLSVCQYCRTAVIALLGIAQEDDRNNNNPQEPANDLLTRFARINLAIEECEHERLGAYAEVIVDDGQDKANQRFPDVVAHLKICSDCRSVLTATIAFISESEETD